MPERTDIELFLEFKEQGNLRALEALINRYKKAVLNFFWHLSGDEASSEDLAQEVFIRLARSAGKYTPQAKFSTFLYRIVHNIWIDHGRIGVSKPRQVSLEVTIGRDCEDTLKDIIDSGAPKPIDELIDNEKEDILRNALKGVPEEQRLVVELSLFGHLNYYEIAEVLEVPYGTVKSRLRLAIARLRELV
ncbi:MAG: sigma-70 family RNA polymerase sigma factor, partial [Planctomycetota bacterium]